MLEKKTVFTITEIKDNKEGSFFDKIFEFIGCVKKSKE